jgi:predicted ArsR family transcriptional regulator
VKLLDDIGFQPELTQDGSAIKLYHCPFHELARSQPDVVCNVHLGLLRGALRQLGAPAGATRLIPFVTPQLCVVEMGPRPTE